MVLTGAGCSTESGIPDYRDESGGWKRKQPLRYAEFLGGEGVRRRYWARSFAGWEQIAAASPNRAHRALAALEAEERLHHLITQNVDGLHQRAGSRRVLDLHGRLEAVECLDCGEVLRRSTLQQELALLNPGFVPRGVYAPDGDADLAEGAAESFLVPACRRCGGVLKPAVVFFGESVPRPRVEAAFAAVAEADALLVVGSSLMVWSGYRFVRAARERGVPIAAVNLGRTRADPELTLKIAAPCGEVLPEILRRVVADGSRASQGRMRATGRTSDCA